MSWVCVVGAVVCGQWWLELAELVDWVGAELPGWLVLEKLSQSSVVAGL